MQTPTSPNFSDFSFRFCVDLTTIASSIVLTDQSTYIAAGFEGIIFNIYAPSGLLIHQGDWTSPDITVENASYTFSPLVFMGGALMTGTYQVQAWIKDENGVVYQWSEDGVNFKAVDVCLPNSLEGATGYFGGMKLQADADCDNYRLCFFDYTPYVYKGVSGTITNTSLKVIYPPDPNTFQQNPAQQYTILPSCYTIELNGRYQFQAVRTVTYELGNDTCISFRYQFTNENFIVACNATLCAITCDFERLLDKLNEATCNNDNANISKYSAQVVQISGLIIQFNEFKKCGKDTSGILDQIIEIGDFDCESCSPSAIVPNPIICNNGVFSVITPCGDITAQVLQEGQNVQITLQDITYSFVIDQSSQAYLTKTTVVSGCQSQTTFHLDLSSITDKLCQVATDDSDNCCGYLEDKLESSDGSINIETVTVDEEGCRKIDLTASIIAGGILYEDMSTHTVPTNNTENQIYLYTVPDATAVNVPAKTLSRDGDSLRIYMVFQNFLAVSDNNRTIRVKFGGSTLLSLVQVAATIDLYDMEIEIIRLTSSSQRVNIRWNKGENGTDLSTHISITSSAIDLTTGTNNIEVTAQNATSVANSMTFTQFIVELVKNIS